MRVVLNRKFTISPRAALEERIRFTDMSPEWTPNAGRRVRAQWWWRYGAKVKQRTPTRDKNPDRPLRIGYVSGDFILHSACTVFGPLLLSHSADYIPVCYSSTPRASHDAATRFFAENAVWRDVEGWTDDEVADQVERDQIDILVDCSGFTSHNRLQMFAARPAPVQVNAWGYVYPTTFPCFDAIFTDAICVPPEEREGIERVVELPCVLYYPDRGVFVETNELPCLSAPPVFGTFNRAAKIDERAIQLWRRILDAVPGSTFVLKSGDKEFTSTHARVREVLGVERVRFIGQTHAQAHAESYLHLDLNLDPIAQNGGVSSMESLWMGVPMVTLPGGQSPTRMSKSFLTCLGLKDFIATSDDDYAARVVLWVTARKTELAEIRRGLRDRMRASPMCAGYVPAVESAYRMLWKEWSEK